MRLPTFPKPWVAGIRWKPSRYCLAEDGALLLIDFEQGLLEAGFRVVATTSGRQALELLNAAESIFQGVVTDIRFREPPDGWDVARVAREIDPEIPVVYVSGHGTPDWASKGVPNSIMLEKPFAMAQLVAAMSQMLNDRRTAP